MNNHKLFEQWAKVAWGRDAWRHTSPTSGEWDAWQAGVMSERSRIKQICEDSKSYWGGEDTAAYIMTQIEKGE